MTLQPLEPAANLDRAVSERTRKRIADGMSDNTRKAYERNLTAFTAWCRTEGRSPLPCTAETLAEYVTVLCDAGRAPSSIEQAIATIRSAHRLAGFEHQPDTAAARLVLRSHRRERAQAGKRTRKAPPIVLDALRAMVDASDPGTAAGLRDRLLLVLGFALMGRRSELAALDLGDVSETADGLVVHIRMSKTDQDAIGEEVAIPRGQHADTDPVRILAAWRALLAERGITGGRLLRGVDRHGRIGESISPDGINRAVRAAAVRAKLPDAEKYTAHSLRAGGATAAYGKGAPVAVIAQHGRWAENSPVVLGYIRAVDKWTSNPMNSVL
jgi:site-specific recombinase XerD